MKAPDAELPQDRFEAMSTFEGLLQATLRAARGKRDRPDVVAFLADQERRIIRLSDDLRAGRWRPGGYREVVVKEPKPRCISVACFADRVVHQALHAALVPVLERGYIEDSYASLPGRGHHRAVARYETFRDRAGWVLRCHIYRCFPSMDHRVLKRDLRRRVRCGRLLNLLDLIIDGSNAQEPVETYFPGDDLFEPMCRRRGLPLGNLTSQMFGNVYLNPLDHHVKEVLRVKGYLRYLDDFALFGDSPEQLTAWKESIQHFLDQRRLLLHPVKTRILPTAEAVTFFGYELFPGGRRLPRPSVGRAWTRLQALRTQWLNGRVDEQQVRSHLSGWVAHARYADTWRPRQRMFGTGWFNPWGEPARPR